jgi:hypothetical protein
MKAFPIRPEVSFGLAGASGPSRPALHAGNSHRTNVKPLNIGASLNPHRLTRLGSLRPGSQSSMLPKAKPVRRFVGKPRHDRRFTFRRQGDQRDRPCLRAGPCPSKFKHARRNDG